MDTHRPNFIAENILCKLFIIGVVAVAIGYIALALVLGYEWGLCTALTGTIWTGVFEHFFNNFISNSLHTITETGIDEMQIIRIILSNVLSLLIVLMVARHGRNARHKFFTD